MPQCLFDSPIGTLTLTADADHLTGLDWARDAPADRDEPAASVSPDGHPILAEACAQLDDYFAGKRQTFDLPLAFSGTAFQQEVWQALRTIPFGQTRTYGAIALQIGRPRAVRAVGAANARNPLPIVAPCHRVIGASGALTGFAGGLDVKRYLLDLEDPKRFETAG